MALADFLQALLRQPGGPQNALAQAASDQGSAGPNGSAAYQNALQAAFQAQGAPQAAPQGVAPMTTGSVTPQGGNAPVAASQPVLQPSSGGGLLSGLESIFNPRAAARNQTASWLKRQGLDDGTAALLAGNPRLLNQYIGQKMQGQDPMAGLKAEKLGLEVENLRNPTTDDIREYQFAKNQGYTGSFTDFMQSNRKAGATNINLPNPDANMFAGLPKDVRDEMFKRQETAQDAADLINVTNQGLQLLDQGAITGAGSTAKIAAIKWAQTLGVPVPDDIVSAANNTETYRSIMAKAVGKVIKNFGSGTGLSDADRQYAERLAGGDTTLNEPAIRRILAAGAKQAQERITHFNAMRDKVMGGDLGAMLNVDEPKPYQPAPQEDRERQYLDNQYRSGDGWTDLGNGVRVRKLGD